MPTARRSRTIAAPAQQLWEVIADPHHLPRWWPRVMRVEDVEGSAFTEVMQTAKGKYVRADFELVEADEQAGTLRFEQRVDGTPFARLLRSASTMINLAPEGAGTCVTIELSQSLAGTLARLGSFLVRRAAVATVEEALDGLERISG
ncbi:MAG TPA: SRPBCC family protein [Solirubrobacteraceae bacterium]|nr:SRPBCC family protein [Solirubrobacteraceae bacterium]